MKALQHFLIAVQFLTRLPVRLRAAPSDQDVGRSVLWYPLIGALIGCLLAALAALLHGRLGALPSAALLLLTWVLASGGLHLDGLADSADAWAGGRGERERMLAIMKDPYCGPLGVTAIVVILLLKFAALSELATQANPWPLLIAPLLGRAFLLPLFASTDYVRPNGLGAAMHAHLPRRTAAAIVLFSGIAIIGIFGTTGIWTVLAGAGVFLLLRNMMQRHIGGMTGDTAGATVEVIEAATTMLMAFLLRG